MKKAHQRTDEIAELVLSMSRSGQSAPKIATAMGMNVRTLKKHYAVELEMIVEEAQKRGDAAKVKLAGLAIDRVEEMLGRPECPPAIAIFILKACAGFRETAPSADIRRELHEFTDDELRVIVADRARRGRGDPAPEGSERAPDIVREVPKP